MLQSPPHQRRRDRRRRAADAAARAAGLEDVELAVDRAGLQPLGHRALDHVQPPAVGHRGASSTTARWATRATARRSTACGSPSLGLIEGFEPDLIVSGINHGSNLGDDITYSGTVAAALEGVVLGVPGIAVSPAVAGARDGLPARRAVRLRGRGRVHGADRGPARRRAAARGDAAQHQRAGRRSRRRRGGAARQAHLPRRAEGRRGGGRPPALPHLRRLARCTTTRRGPTWRRCRRAACRSRRCTST